MHFESQKEHCCVGFEPARPSGSEADAMTALAMAVKLPTILQLEDAQNTQTFGWLLLPLS